MEHQIGQKSTQKLTMLPQKTTFGGKVNAISPMVEKFDAKQTVSPRYPGPAPPQTPPQSRCARSGNLQPCLWQLPGYASPPTITHISFEIIGIPLSAKGILMIQLVCMTAICLLAWLTRHRLDNEKWCFRCSGGLELQNASQSIVSIMKLNGLEALGTL